jgi:alpha-amylase
MTNNPKLMDSRHLVLCFNIHQPKRLNVMPDSEANSSTFLDAETDGQIMQRIARDSYIPANTLLTKLIEQYPNIKVSFSISGLALEQMATYAPAALKSFKILADTGAVDFVAEPYYHSLAFLLDSDEFEIQVLHHVEKIMQYFGVRPTVFRNTNMLYNDEIGRRIHMMGFEGIITEGCERGLRQQCGQHLFEHRTGNGLKILMRHQNLSDDIAFRAGKKYWNISVDKYLSWLEAMPADQKLITLGVDYETFGEHNKSDSGIFEFLENLLLILAIQNNFTMATPSDIVHNFESGRQISIPDYIAAGGTDLSDLLGNDRQREAFGALIALEQGVKRYGDPELTELWKVLQSADHFYYMSDNATGPESLSPFESPQEAFDCYMRCIRYLESKINGLHPEKHNEASEAERRNLNVPTWAQHLESHTGPVI